ncbi:hypothetical protein BDV23DRAFT_143728 [Aspergillus alliaceus]|uniref:Uncharacterized protein n=1 Tax=Petromyces alliaceus TaxID=209559 RepID=A0A5N7CRR6_PETAA|nr:hypothetical protein BDV23DRAFT_143728 [Aspergillus alliaceus]
MRADRVIRTRGCGFCIGGCGGVFLCGGIGARAGACWDELFGGLPLGVGVGWFCDWEVGFGGFA